jgi:hypothetical protein
MNVTEKLFLASIFALSIAGPVQAQSPTQEGDYYVGDKMIFNKRRAEALKTCTHNKSFESDAYLACMQREGQAP